MVKVRDSGLGIPGDQLKRVFKRFYRVPGRDLTRVKGTGPWPVHCSVRHQETRRPRASRECRGRAGKRLHHPASHNLSAMSSVLIVEDEQHLADGLRFNLEAEGYDAEVVGDGETALEHLTTQPTRYDAVVLDVMLPGIDGFTVAAELRKAGQFVPVLMLTAMGRAEDVLRGFAAGADDYLPKPFELAILLARLSGLLRRKRDGC